MLINSKYLGGIDRRMEFQGQPGPKKERKEK
jgi:hypothetical protein